MPKTPRGKRVVDASTGTFQVVNKAPNGEAEPYFDKARGVWVAPWRKPDGKVGRPTGRTRVLAAASRDRHMAKAAEEERFAALDEGFEADSTVADVTAWWLQNVARHRVRATTFATYRKQARLIVAGLCDTPARQSVTLRLRRSSRTCSMRVPRLVLAACGLCSCRSWTRPSALGSPPRILHAR